MHYLAKAGWLLLLLLMLVLIVLMPKRIEQLFDSLNVNDSTTDQHHV